MTRVGSEFSPETAGRIREAAYRPALAETPHDIDIHLQLGHTLKLQGRKSPGSP
jgi:hypothetical protein